ncbi:lysylphosphatidylglycerol synthase domain-containing protein [Halobacteriovorax marinus]|uniref:lysylphosphatidylglycerol synthase domain-containing protein n=1 Tax=Halobacteriovorax marinus TaxID=97084 RepID=UPI003A8D86B4
MFSRGVDLLKRVLGLAILIYLCIFLSQNFSLIKNLNPLSLSKFALVFFGFYFFLSIPFWFTLLKKVPLLDLYSLSFLANFLNLFLPFRGGIIVRASVLKKKFSISFKRYTSVSVLLSVSSIFSLGLFSLICSESAIIRLSAYYYSIKTSSFIFFLSGLIFFLFSHVIVKRFKRDYLLDVFKLENIVVTVICYFACIFLYFLRYKILFNIFNIIIDDFSLFTITVFHLSIGLLTILPGNLGLKEFSFVGICSLFGIPSNISLAMVSLDRVLQVLYLSFASSLYMNRIGLKFSKLLNFRKDGLF